MKLLLIMITLCVSNLSFAKSACDFDFKDYCATIKFSKKPSRSYSSDFKLYFTDKKTDKFVIPKEKVMSYLWMKMKNGRVVPGQEKSPMVRFGGEVRLI